MRDVLLLTAPTLPRDDVDMPLIVDALAERGVRGLVRGWTEPGPPPAGVELAVIRSTWDYAARRAEFLDAMGALAQDVPLHNPVPVLAWNSHKGYLVELAAAGVPVVPSVLVVRDGRTLPDLGVERIVIKPAVSAGAVGVGLFPAGSAEAAAHLAVLTAAGDALVQPFQESVREGERSLLFFDGELSHAVRKVPAPTDFRVQERHGGRNEAVQASPADLDVARRALAVAPADLLYARVDLVGPTDAPLVMELELIEPGLFLPEGPGSAERFADAILRRLPAAR